MERREREAYLLLLHTHNLTGGDPDLKLWCERLAADLGFDGEDCFRLVQHLVNAGFARFDVGTQFSITPEGIEYVESGAGRRRSVRLEPSNVVPAWQ